MHFTLTDLAADITQNGAESGASLLELEIQETVTPGCPENPVRKEFRFIIRDNGKGMRSSELDRAMDPFVSDGIKHPGRRIGLGLPFLGQTAVQSGGGWRISSTGTEGETTHRSGGAETTENSAYTGSNVFVGGNASGTTVEAWFDLANMDTPPVGDISGLFRTALLFTGPEEVILKRIRKHCGEGAGYADLDYEARKTELIEALGDLEDVSSLVLLGQYLRSLEGDNEET